MKTGLLLGIIAVSFSLSAHAKDTATFKTEKEKFSYSVGYQLGQNLKRQKLDIDPKITAQGMQHGIGDAAPKMKPDDMRNSIQTYQQKEQEKIEVQAKKNQALGEAFLAENKKKEGVTTLESGVQYKVITEGKGKKPKSSDTVVAHYRGTLINGTEFDSSYKRNSPATFPVQGVIRGWQEVLPLMKAGSKWEVYIPSELGYGPRGTGGTIGPNEVLIFEIELLSINESAEKKDEK